MESRDRFKDLSVYNTWADEDEPEPAKLDPYMQIKKLEKVQVFTKVDQEEPEEVEEDSKSTHSRAQSMTGLTIGQLK